MPNWIQNFTFKSELPGQISQKRKIKYSKRQQISQKVACPLIYQVLNQIEKGASSYCYTKRKKSYLQKLYSPPEHF
jgi:hypothetical protein